MAPRIVSPGQGPQRDVILTFLRGGDTAAVMAPAAVVIEDVGPPLVGHYDAASPNRGILRLPQYLDMANEAAGGNATGRVIVAGFSEGCQAGRSFLLDGDGGRIDGLVCADGTHLSNPPDPAKYRAWKNAMEEARAGGRPFAASHASVAPGNYLSTHDTLELLAGTSLPQDPTGPTARLQALVEGNLLIESWGGHNHYHQGQEVFPSLLAFVLERAPGSRILATLKHGGALVAGIVAGVAAVQWAAKKWM